MADFYSNLKATAERLIREKGRSAVIIAPGTPTGPAWNPQPGAPVQTPVRIVELSMGGQVRFIESLRVDTEIVESDKIIMVSTETGVVPKVGHQMLDSLDGIKYQVVAVSPASPGPVTLFWKMVVRK